MSTCQRGPVGGATDERGLPPGHRLRLPPARSPGRGSREPRRRLAVLRSTSGDALAMDELGVERRIHSCMLRLPGMVEATAAWMPADGGIGRDWARRSILSIRSNLVVPDLDYDAIGYAMSPESFSP